MALRSCNTAEGSRVDIRPRGRQIMISTMANPNKQHAVLGRIKG